MTDVIAALFIIPIVIGIYFLPTIFACWRQHPMLIPIAIINVAFGWTFMGWVVALAWAFAGGGQTGRPRFHD